MISKLHPSQVSNEKLRLFLEWKLKEYMTVIKQVHAEAWIKRQQMREAENAKKADAI